MKLIPTNYDILTVKSEPVTDAIFSTHKDDDDIHTGLKYPIRMVSSLDCVSSPILLVSNAEDVTPYWTSESSSIFKVSISKTPEVLTPDTCTIDDADLLLVLKWVAVNYDTILLLSWLYENKICRYGYVNEDTGRLYIRSGAAALSSLVSVD